MGMRELVSVNGEIFKPSEAKISVFDRGFLYGDGVYEVARSYGRVYFELEAHTERLFRSANMIMLDIGRTPQQVMDEIYRVSSIADRDDAYMRIIVTRGEGTISLDPRAATKPNVVIIVKDLSLVPAEKYASGVGVVISKTHRNTRRALDPNIKSGNYLNNILAFVDTHKLNAFESVMVNREGFVTEGTTSNFYIVEKGVISTAPLGFDILSGITRRIVLELCEKTRIPLQEAQFTADRVFSADECFLTSSTREVLPVTEVDGKKIADGKPGVVSKRLGSLYKDYIQEYCRSRQHLANKR